jgi:hypothetical protein
MANMTAALAYVCKRIPADKGAVTIAQAGAMIACAHSGWLTLNDFQNSSSGRSPMMLFQL